MMNDRARIRFATTTLVVLIVASPLYTSAEEPGIEWYIQGALSFATGSAVGVDNSIVGGSLAGGAFFSSWLAAELQVAGGVDTTDSGNAALEFTIDGKFYPMPIWAEGASETFQPYLQLGIGYAHVYCVSGLCGDGDGLGGFLWKIGFGSDYKITEQFSLYVEYDYGQASVGDEDRFYGRNNFNFGATYRF
jgi:opacity protein-like surface antigen